VQRLARAHGLGPRVAWGGAIFPPAVVSDVKVLWQTPRGLPHERFSEAHCD